MDDGLRKLLEAEKLSQHVERFEENGINDLEVFKTLDQGDLKVLHGTGLEKDGLIPSRAKSKQKRGKTCF